MTIHSSSIAATATANKSAAESTVAGRAAGSTSMADGKDLESGAGMETVYDWDTVLVFPRQSGGERRRGGMYNCERFVRLLLGLRTEKIGKEKVELIDKAKAILRTDRCFLDAQQKPNAELQAIAEELATTKLEKRRSELEMDAVKVKRAFLVEEYKAFCRTDEPILQSKFCDLVVRAILKSVQDACGLECKMGPSGESPKTLLR